MSRRRTKTERRRKRVEKRACRARTYHHRQEQIAKFPAFSIEHQGAPDGLLRNIRAILLEIAAQHELIFPAPLARIYQAVRKYGLSSVSTVISEETPEANVGNVVFNIVSVLGQVFFHKLPEEVFDNYLPFYGIRFLPGRTFRVQVRSLQRQKTPGGTAYYSPHRPRVELKTGTLVAAFYRHAAERICERTVGDWKSYFGFDDAFSYLHDCVWYEPWEHDDQLGFVLYERCQAPFFTMAYAEQILDKPLDTNARYFYRVGYCPSRESDGLLVAKTLLLPGMAGTPEHTWYINNVDRSGRGRKHLRERANELSKDQLARSGDFRLLKQFHDGGIPQVRQLEHPVFTHDLNGT